MTSTGLPPVGGNFPRPKGFWRDIADRAMEAPGLWIMGAEDVSTGVLSYLTNGRNKAFVRDEGEFEFAVRGWHYPESNWSDRKGSRRGTLYVSFTPKGWTAADREEAQRAAAAEAEQHDEENAAW